VIIKDIVGLPSDRDYIRSLDLPVVKVDESIPPLKYITITNAKRILDQRDRKYEVAGVGEFVEDVELRQDMYYIKSGLKKVDIKNMPELKGLSVREALRSLDFAKLRVVIKGDGLVANQSIKAGKSLDKRSTLYLTCK